MPFVAAKGHQLHYADSHPDGAPENGLTFVFIHGLGSSQNYYFPILPYLTPHHRCITFDTYGSARSAYMNEPVSIESIVEDVVNALVKLSVSSAVFVGHSMGGLAVTLLATMHPAIVRGVVAIGPTHPSDTLVGGMNKRREIVLTAGMEPMANTIPYQATGTQCSPLAKSFIRELLIGQNPSGYAALCQAIANAPIVDYTKVQSPFLLIAGEEDKSAPLEGCQYIFDLVSSRNKKMEVLDKVGHWHCIEAPEQVGKAIVQFTGSL
ncbi:hypothetical protein EYZ11_009436 [Aspergillus tanneri]|uniref:AB hydrolase-1 domain-containing protein n=1 Tax=Aspergillus tanneri TaxID=1220188 RepID=A0A4S3J8B6_9EURO|nr:uncharacterized protein ATNIH1004_005980 [Aspergillus tanneri]KAA8647290.1 hypothetical protein ATNIH1004_005980 [Aspergillus tanneri]THC91092.1 hypothetical protein EYZ11_009436 [Aspergillus tanneri]